MATQATKGFPFPVGILAACKRVALGRGAEHHMRFLLDVFMALPAKLGGGSFARSESFGPECGTWQLKHMPPAAGAC